MLSRKNSQPPLFLPRTLFCSLEDLGSDVVFSPEALEALRSAAEFSLIKAFKAAQTAAPAADGSRDVSPAALRAAMR